MEWGVVEEKAPEKVGEEAEEALVLESWEETVVPLGGCTVVVYHQAEEGTVAGGWVGETAPVDWEEAMEVVEEALGETWVEEVRVGVE